MASPLIKTVGIKDLKNHLSTYIREVRLGTRVLVTDRDLVVAELREPLADVSPDPREALRQQWIREGKLRPALRHPATLPRTHLNSPPGTAQRLIDEDRGE